MLPLIGADTKFQPVYVDDVAAAIKVCIENGATAGGTFELGGPEILSFRELMEYMLRVIGRKRYLLPIPQALAGAMAFGAEFKRWNPPLTRDQVRLLQHDNVASQHMPGFSALGIAPTRMEMVVPSYLSCYQKGNMSTVGELV